MKKNWIMRVAYLTTIVVLISTVAISGTFARYTWSNTIENRASVAQFAFRIGDQVVNDTTDTVSLNLFDTVSDPTLGYGYEDFNVRHGMIAPGTTGQFYVLFQNESDVFVSIDLDADIVNNSGIPIEFCNSHDFDNWQDPYTFFSNLSFEPLGIDYGCYLLVIWRWAFDGNNYLDSEIGMIGDSGVRPEVIVNLYLTVDQVD